MFGGGGCGSTSIYVQDVSSTYASLMNVRQYDRVWTNSIYNSYVSFKPLIINTENSPQKIVETNPLKDTNYTEKGLRQINNDKMHGFPKLIDTSAVQADSNTIVGHDGKFIQWCVFRVP